MQVIIRWVEGNKYEAWLIVGDSHVFLGYHYVYTHLPLETIQKNLEQGLQNLWQLSQKPVS